MCYTATTMRPGKVMAVKEIGRVSLTLPVLFG
jgi:hypothetical protein